MKYPSAFSLSLLAGTLCLTVGCDTDLVDPTARFHVFTMVIQVETTGQAADADGYLVEVQPDGGVTRLAAQELLRLPGQPKGREYVVTLSDVAANCEVVEGTERRFMVEETDIRTLARKAFFGVECS